MRVNEGLSLSLNKLIREINRSCELEKNLLLIENPCDEDKKILKEKFETLFPQTKKSVAEYALGALLVMDVLPSEGKLSDSVRKTWFYGEYEPMLMNQRIITRPKEARLIKSYGRICSLYSVSYELPVKIAQHFRKGHDYLHDQFKESLESHFNVLMVMSETRLDEKGYGQVRERAENKAVLLGLMLPFSNHVLELSRLREIPYDAMRAVYDYWEDIKGFGMEPNNFYVEKIMRKLGWKHCT